MKSMHLHSVPQTAAPESDLLREANHRIANHLGVLVSMVQAQISRIDQGPGKLSRDAAKTMLQATAGMLVSVSRLHHLLSEQSQFDKIFLFDHVVEVCTSLVSSLGLKERVFFVHKWAADCRLSPEQAQYIGLLINEILVNAIKHAHPTGLPVQIEIRCERHDNGRVTLSIGDDGVGLPEGTDASAKGAGFKLIHMLANLLGADLGIESDSLGLTFVITLPPEVQAVKCLSVVGD
jgi:two-component sensor histidine kinase